MSEKPDRKQTIMEVRDQLRIKYESNLRFIEQLLKEKGELRDTVVERLGEIEKQMKQLEDENKQLRDQVHDMQRQMVQVATKQEQESAQLQAVLMQDESLINVQVASVQLHSTLDFMEVVTLIGEIVINLVGSENFALCLLREGDQYLVPVHSWGSGGRRVDPFRIGEGIIGGALTQGQTHIWRRTRGASEDGNPMVAVPLMLAGGIVGALIIFDLLPQKAQLGATDDDLLECISAQGAAALLGANFFANSKSGRMEFSSRHFE